VRNRTAVRASVDASVPSAAKGVKKATVCYDSGKKYSMGAPLKKPNGKLYKCGWGGGWYPHL
jgi:hypothetical protein